MVLDYFLSCCVTIYLPPYTTFNMSFGYRRMNDHHERCMSAKAGVYQFTFLMFGMNQRVVIDFSDN